MKKKNVQINKIQGYIIMIVLLAIPPIVAHFYLSDPKKPNAIIIPKKCGWYATREWDLNEFRCKEGSNQAKVEELWDKEPDNEKEDKQGFQKLYGRYLIACTQTFGKVGDKIDFVMSDGTVLKCIIYDNKSMEKTFYDQKPANKWGHDDGAVVMEFVGSRKLESNPYKNLGLKNERTVKAIRYGSIFNN